MDADPLIRDISDTALWAAVFRARESARSDALFHDPFAERMAGARGERIIETVPHAGENSWAWVMRTYLMDRIIAAQVAAGVDLVINLAAGLDARPYRMDLPESLRWVEIDLPQIISYKSEILGAEKPHCQIQRIALNLADADLRRETLGRVAAGRHRILAISEGLLIYLPAEEAAALAGDLAAVPGMESWVIDVVSPGLLRMLQQTTGEHTERAGAPYRFGPAEGPAFFAPHGWETVSADSVFQAAIRTGRVPPELAPFVGFPEPPPPFGPEAMWSGVCLLRAQS
jgi:methyltransferase (TIGR00027 family)